jgi:hypothetical protein
MRRFDLLDEPGAILQTGQLCIDLHQLLDSRIIIGLILSAAEDTASNLSTP